MYWVYGVTMGARMEQWKAEDTGSGRHVILEVFSLDTVCWRFWRGPATLMLFGVL